MTLSPVPPRPSAAVRIAGFRLLFVVFGLLSSVLCLPAFAAPVNKSFDVPAGDAAVALKQFAQQAGQQVAFPAQDVKGVKTAPVKGEYTLKEALDIMLAGTGLVVAFDEKSSTFAVSREPDPNGPRGALPAATTPKDQSKVEDGKLVLDAYQVAGIRDSGIVNEGVIPRREDEAINYTVIGRGRDRAQWRHGHQRSPPLPAANRLLPS